MTRSVSAPRLLVDGALTGPGTVVLDGDRVVDVLPGVLPPGPDHLTLPTGILTPGLVDLQVNGMFGHDMVETDADGWGEVVRRLPSTGVTAFVPTFITAPLATMSEGLVRAAEAMRALDGAGARILGVHTEGPFLSPRRAGMHPTEHMREPTADLLDALLDGPGGGAVVMVTLAP